MCPSALQLSKVIFSANPQMELRSLRADTVVLVVIPQDHVQRLSHVGMVRTSLQSLRGVQWTSVETLIGPVGLRPLTHPGQLLRSPSRFFPCKMGMMLLCISYDCDENEVEQARKTFGTLTLADHAAPIAGTMQTFYSVSSFSPHSLMRCVLRREYCCRQYISHFFVPHDFSPYMWYGSSYAGMCRRPKTRQWYPLSSPLQLNTPMLLAAGPALSSVSLRDVLTGSVPRPPSLPHRSQK